MSRYLPTLTTRTLDELNRIVLPADICADMDWQPGARLDLFRYPRAVVLESHRPACRFCGTAAGLMPYKGQHICADCRHDIATL